MSIVVKFSENSILYPAPVRINKKVYAIALEGLRHTFDTLVEVSERLEAKLYAFTVARHQNTDFKLREASSISADIWIMIDNFRRVLMFANEAQIEIPADIKGALLQAKDFRDSFHHLEERIPDFFASHGLSVYGDYFWFSRFNKGDDETYNLLTTSTVKGDSRLDLDAVRMNTRKFKDRLGVYNLNVMYAKSKVNGVDDKGKPKYDAVRATLCIDEVVAKVNKYIPLVEDAYKRLYAPYIKPDKSNLADLFSVVVPFISHTVSDSEEHNFNLRRVVELRENIKDKPSTDTK